MKSEAREGKGGTGQAHDDPPGCKIELAVKLSMRLLLVVLAACAGVGVLMVGAALISGSGDSVSPEEALATDASFYAEEYGVSQGEAVRRLSIQEQMSEVAEGLQALAPDRYAGSWLYHEGGFGLVVTFRGAPDGDLTAPMRTIAETAPAPVEVRWGAEIAMDELLAILDQVEWPEDAGYAGMSTDEMNGGLRIQLQPNSKWVGREAELAETLESEYGVPFRIETLDSVLEDQ